MLINAEDELYALSRLRGGHLFIFGKGLFTSTGMSNSLPTLQKQTTFTYMNKKQKKQRRIRKKKSVNAYGA